MEENTMMYTVPSGYIKRDRLFRVGSIFKNMSVCFGILILVAFLSMVIIPLLQIFLLALVLTALIFVVLFTLGLAFVMPYDPVGKLWALLEGVVGMESGEMLLFLMNTIPYIAGVGMVCCALSIVLLACSKKKGIGGKIALVSVFAVAMIVALVIYVWGIVS